MATTSREFGTLRWPDVKKRLNERSILIQPMGAIEQHGPHLPVNTDQVVADEVSRALVRQSGDDLDLWLLPTISYTKSNEHAHFPGSVWMSQATMAGILDDLGRSVAMLPTKRLVFLNAHGGNSALLQTANRELRLAHGLMTFLTHPGLPADQGGTSPASELGMGIHGGTDETSIMLHLRPELVEMSLATRNVPEKLAANKYVRFGGRVAFGWLSSDFGPDGHIGDPVPATAELGKELFEGSVRALGESMAEVREFNYGN